MIFEKLYMYNFVNFHSFTFIVNAVHAHCLHTLLTQPNFYICNLQVPLLVLPYLMEKSHR